MINLNDYLAIGQNGDVFKMINNRDLENKFGNELGNILGTPRILHWAVDACILCIHDFLPEGYTSVGVSTHLKHINPTGLGMQLTIHVSVSALVDNSVVFDIEIWDEQGDIAKGTHKRLVVSDKTVLEKIKEKSA